MILSFEISITELMHVLSLIVVSTIMLYSIKYGYIPRMK